MYAIKNNVQLVGVVVDKPIVRGSEEGKKTARFSIFIDDCYYNAKGAKVTESQSHVLVAQGKIAVIAEKYLEKDTQVAVLGRLVNRNFRNSRGISKTVTEVLVSELLILDKLVQDDCEYYLSLV
ncbi:single-stranded DNA-binding protein [Terrimonas sp. NA20]|uniref:Single-stranded DNA-binding protein n=1 Tax=Terrimonas ginsenosidimutans TaxID=2908004 RepID=A0ABS9KL02_9BACT|nr:single-stranded DNA-binding protein [Terrimonas ginsenosidimutans]MCG2613000.1 single-stranded DNA-binding protein [Terrimonas ginsenosidimutans]